MQTIRLSTTPGVVNPGAYLSQYDVGRQIAFLLFDDTGQYVPATGSTVHIMATKPSGFGFDVACTWSQNTVTVTVTDEMSNESGSFGAELRIEKNGDILGTANFLWNVERSTHPDGTVDGNTEAQNLMQAIMAAITDAENAAAAAAQSGLSDDFKQALLNCFSHVAWINDQGQTYYNALYDALYPPIPATSISLDRSTINTHTINVSEALAVNVQPPNTTDTVSWSSSDTSVATVTQNGVVDIVGWGSAVITATAGSVSATCTVTATNITLSSIAAVFTQGAATIYSDDSLDTLKQYLVVTATYSDSSTEVLADSDYTLSGTLTVGTATITATYEGETDTFTVTVTQAVQHYAIANNLSHVSSSNAGVTTVQEHGSYTTSLGVQTGYFMQSVTVTMGGVDITSTAYNSGTGTISIADVTGNVVITASAALSPASISAVYTQGGTVWDTDSLDTLKTDLVVTATYADSSTATIAASGYTLSGSLTAGTSTVTVTYGGQTATFSVTVMHYGYITDGLVMWLDGEKNGVDGAHETTLTTWVDQSGNSWDWTNNGATVNAKSLTFNGSSAYLGRSYQSVPNNVAMIEIVAKKTKGGCIVTGFGRNKIGNVNIPSTGNNIIFHTAAGTGSDKNTSFDFGTAGEIHSANSSGYLDGQAVQNFVSSSSDWQYEYPAIGKYRGSNGNNTQYVFQGEIYCIRMYSRILTEDEILSNYANDVERFGIGG